MSDSCAIVVFFIPFAIQFKSKKSQKCKLGKKCVVTLFELAQWEIYLGSKYEIILS